YLVENVYDVLLAVELRIYKPRKVYDFAQIPVTVHLRVGALRRKYLCHRCRRKQALLRQVFPSAVNALRSLALPFGKIIKAPVLPRHRRVVPVNHLTARIEKTHGGRNKGVNVNSAVGFVCFLDDYTL